MPIEGSEMNLKEELDMVWRYMKPRVTDTVQQEIIKPLFEELHSTVKGAEIFQSVEEKLLAGGTRNNLPREGSLKMKFLNKVCDPAQTGNELTGRNGEWLELALVDANGHIVTCGPESSAEAEIVLLDASGIDDENNTTCENFEGRIIRTRDNQKPRFAKSATSFIINLKDGIGKLIGLKLGHGKRIKAHSCMLGARIVQKLRGPPIIVQEAWTAPFKVIDKRDKRFEKHRPPKLSSEVWRLDKIDNKGAPCKRLKEKNINTLKEFLFWFYVDPEGLRQILCVSNGIWNTIVAHAETCTVEDKDNKTFCHKSSTEPQMEVIYDVVGKLKGVVNKSHFVPSDNLSADDKDHARKLLSFVLKLDPEFGELYKKPFNIEVFLQQEKISDYGYQTMELDSQFQSIDLFDFWPCHSLGSEEMGELRNPTSGLFPDPKFTDGGTPTDLGHLTDSGTRTDSVNTSFASSSSTMAFGDYGRRLDMISPSSPNPMDYYGPPTELWPR